jgi:hypothetical protein
MDSEPKTEKNERDIRRVIVWGPAAAFGGSLGSLASLQSSPTGFYFELSPRSFVAFIIGALLVFPFWRVVFSPPGKSRSGPGRIILAMLFLALLGIGSFLYPARLVPSEKLHAMFIGLGIAVCALSMVGGGLLLMAHFLEADARQNENPTPPQKK